MCLFNLYASIRKQELGRCSDSPSNWGLEGSLVCLLILFLMRWTKHCLTLIRNDKTWIKFTWPTVSLEVTGFEYLHLTWIWLIDSDCHLSFTLNRLLRFKGRWTSTSPSEVSCNGDSVWVNKASMRCLTKIHHRT